MEETILSFGKRYWPIREYSRVYEQSLASPEEFWEREARKLNWFRTWDKVLEWEPPFAKWFVGGKLNASYQCLDRHLKTWRRNKVAIYWEGEGGQERVLSYSSLFREVNRFAYALKKIGLKARDKIALYLPMIPELPIAMLAAARIGVTHTVIFSGFSSQALAERVNDVEAKVIVTADAGFRRGKLIELKSMVDEVAEKCPSVEHIIVVNRADLDIHMKDKRDLWYHKLLSNAKDYIRPEPLPSTHPLYILYTSGTTGKPKGVTHSTGGYLVFNNSMYKWVFNTEEESVYWCTADVGWVTGHSSIVYAPFMHGATIVLCDCPPDYPNPDRWWQAIDKYKVTIFYTSPTAIRMLMRYGEKWLKDYDLSTLRLLGSVGEPINPETWLWYYKNIGKERCPVVDTWWQTETGGVMISPAPGISLVPLKPGSATLPLPGIDADVVDENGNSCPPGVKGYLVINRPWPGMCMTLYKDPERYKEVYFSRFKDKYYTGDYCTKDEDGYFWLLGRADEVLKVAGHRLSTIELENVTVSLPEIVEAAVIGASHPVKGEGIIIFAVPKEGVTPDDTLAKGLREYIRKTIGPIATPQEIFFVQKLPKTRSGKIMRRVLKAVAEGKALGDLTTLEDEAPVKEVKRAYEELKGLIKE